MNFRTYLPLTLSLLTVSILFLSTCASGNPNQSAQEPGGRILIWHSWEGKDAEALEAILTKFEAINPNVRVNRSHVHTDTLRTDFEAASTSGLGPDLLLGPVTWIRALAEAGRIAPVTADEEVLQRFLSASLETVRYDGQLYALPVSLQPTALFYNKALVETPATTLDGLLAHAAEGKGVAINTTFAAAFWGIPAFGGRLLDEEGRVILDQGGFANWLAWLKSAREQPGMVLESNRDALSLRFQLGEVAYYVGDPTELQRFNDLLGMENVGVVPLPPGPNGNAGPLLNGDALMFSPASSENQQRLAMQLATFITNAEQQTNLMREARRVPANVRVRVNARLNPVVNGFVAQARTAVPLPNLPDLEAFFRQGTDIYIRVMEGVQEPVDAALAFTNAVNEAYGFAVVTQPTVACTGDGTLQIIHDLDGIASEALTGTIDRFHAVCPAITISAQAVSPQEIGSRLRRFSNASSPDLLLAAHDWVQELAANGTIAEISPLVDAELLQRFRPLTLEGMRTRQGLYGLPLAVEVQVLYYNKTFVENPARTLDDLVLQATAERPVLLPADFQSASWGIGAFGGRLFDENYQVVLNQGGFLEWLTWLQGAKANPGIQLGRDIDALRAQFQRGEAAYFVGSSAALSELRQELGDALGVAILPAGPESNANPFLQITGFVFNSRSSAEQQALAIEFIKFATSVEQQTLWLARMGILPSNAAVSAEISSPEETLLQQLNSAMLLPNLPQTAAVERYGNDAYTLVLDDGATPEQAVQEMVDSINTAINQEGAN